MKSSGGEVFLVTDVVIGVMFDTDFINFMQDGGSVIWYLVMNGMCLRKRTWPVSGGGWERERGSGMGILSPFMAKRSNTTIAITNFEREKLTKCDVASLIVEDWLSELGTTVSEENYN